ESGLATARDRRARHSSSLRSGTSAGEIEGACSERSILTSGIGKSAPREPGTETLDPKYANLASRTWHRQAPLPHPREPVRDLPVPPPAGRAGYGEFVLCKRWRLCYTHPARTPV